MKKISILSLFILMTCIVIADERPLWMRYPAISPDGNTIVFSYQGDLYTVPVTGGEARLLTLHEAYDFSAVWSPDSKSIAFASNRYGGFDIFSIPATGGKAKRLTSNSGGEIPQSFTPDGKYILFHALIQDDPLNAQFPTGVFTELYKVNIEGGRPERILTTPALGATYSNDGKYILYYDRKGYEDNWRKHHISSVTRDIWLYESETGKHRKLTSFEGEDRYPVYSPDGSTVYYLSEREGSFNVWAMLISGDADARQLSSYENHPLRFLSISNDGILCFGYNGELYTGTESKGFKRIPIIIENDDKVNNVVFMKEGKGATEIAVSPDGKESALIIRGEVFVTSTDYNTTRRITVRRWHSLKKGKFLR
jgi:Tol biopolymer transport system component